MKSNYMAVRLLIWLYIDADKHYKRKLDSKEEHDFAKIEDLRNRTNTHDTSSRTKL